MNVMFPPIETANGKAGRVAFVESIATSLVRVKVLASTPVEVFVAGYAVHQTPDGDRFTLQVVAASDTIGWPRGAHYEIDFESIEEVTVL